MVKVYASTKLKYNRALVPCRMSNSPQYRASRALFDLLVNGVKSAVENVASKAFQCNLITSQSLGNATNPNKDEAHRANKLLQAILAQVEQNSTHFDEFVDILQSVPSLKELAVKLEAEFKTQESSEMPVVVVCSFEPSPSRDPHDIANSGELLIT